MRLSSPARSFVSTTVVLLSSTALPRGVPSQQPLRVAIIVRHAEKDTVPKENPPLSAAGRERARALADALRDAGVAAIVTTQQQRTRETAAPLAAALNLRTVTVPTAPDARRHARDVASAVERAGGTVLVVDHQITLPGIVRDLGGPAVRTVCDVEFSNLYVLIPLAPERMRLIRSHYGAPDPPHGPGCKITPVSPR
jgi:broad specificity phosphatase PhoE